MPSRTAILLSALLGFAGPAAAGNCRLTVQGRPVLDDVTCAARARGDDVRVAVEGGGVVAVRRGAMSARLPGAPGPDGRRRVYARAFGRVVASVDPDERSCYFNQTATLCVEP